MNPISHIQETSGGRVRTLIPATPQQKAASFADIIAETSKHHRQKSVQPRLLGTISNQTPTVSELVMNDHRLRSRGWDIINAEINAEKPWTSIPTGTAVYYHPATRELLWKGAGSGPEAAGEAAELQRVEAAHQAAGREAETEETVLGTLSAATPTVSHLLAASPLKEKMWQILNLPVNTARDFSAIPAGAVIHYNSSSGELHWQNPQQSRSLVKDGAGNRDLPPSAPLFPSIATREPAAEETPSPSRQQPVDLSAAVRQFIGTPYTEMDCYSLVVKGLKSLGVRYGGEHGLYRQLTAKAKAQGLPENAFLNGEGLVAATGRRVLHHSFPRVADPATAASRTFDTMKQVLAKGQILSFSTPTRGHTGIIAQQHNGEWTFINSGRMDHPITQTRTSREVGEERLVDELQNWFALARRRNEPLTITLGQVEQERMAALGVESALLASL